MSDNFKNKLTLILGIGLTVRLLFLLFGANIYFDHNIFTFGDSYSFTESIINLFKFGIYSYDLNNPKAYAGRMPLYPFFWGLHYLIFGPKYVYIAVAISQIVLDTISIYLIYRIAEKLFTIRTGFLAAFIYALYPFSIIWVTISGTELFATFMTILYFYLLVAYEGKHKIVILGIFGALTFYSRVYLGIIIPITIIHLFINAPNKKSLTLVKNIFIYSLIFTLLYSVWPIRNYLYSGNFVPLTTKASGYHACGDDFIAMRKWLYVWGDYSEIVNDYHNDIALTDKNITFPDHIFYSQEERILADSIVGLCRKCGSSFYYWKNYTVLENHCDEQIVSGFNSLRKSFFKNQPLAYVTRVPLMNFKKALFKIRAAEKHNPLKGFLLLYRSFLVLTGFITLFYLIRYKPALAISIFILFMYFYICCISRQLQMRYLIQADAMLLIFSARFMDICYTKLEKKKFEH